MSPGTRAAEAATRGSAPSLSRLAGAVLVAALGLALCLAPEGTSAATTTGTTTGRPALVSPAPLPEPAILAQGVSSANPAHLVRDRRWDFSEMRRVFNTVSLLPGDPAAVDEARQAGLSVVLEFDYKREFFSGVDISAKVGAVVEQLLAHPGAVAAVHVADRINERYSADEGLRYLAATAGVLHREVPGVPVLVNVSDWELTCGLPGQSSCWGHDPRFRHETNATLDRLYDSGYLDGFTVADNLKDEDVNAQSTAWRRARERWPAPFILWSTCSQVSFPDDRYTGTPDTAARTVAAYVAAPMKAGADGVALWAWHQLYDGSVYSFLDKDGGQNALWSTLVATSRSITTNADGAAEESLPSAPPATPGPPVSAPSSTGGPPLQVDAPSVLGFGLILTLLGVGVYGRARSRRRREQRPTVQLTAPSVPSETPPAARDRGGTMNRPTGH